MFALVTVVLEFVILDTTIPLNCHVRTVFPLLTSKQLDLDCPQTQGCYLFRIGEHSVPLRILIFRYLFSKAFALLTMSASSLLIVLRMYVLLNTSTFRSHPLIEVSSIAIWNRNKVVMTMAIIIWGINAVLYVRCRLPLSRHVVIGSKTPH